MKTIDSIPITKISRASKLVSTGAKVGVNYLKYYGDKMVNPKEDAKERQQRQRQRRQQLVREAQSPALEALGGEKRNARGEDGAALAAPWALAASVRADFARTRALRRGTPGCSMARNSTRNLLAPRRTNATSAPAAPQTRAARSDSPTAPEGKSHAARGIQTPGRSARSGRRAGAVVR